MAGGRWESLQRCPIARPMAGFRGRRGVEKERGGNRNEDLGGKIAPHNESRRMCSDAW